MVSTRMKHVEPVWLTTIDWVSKILAAFGGVVALLLALNIIADVMGRYLFSQPLPDTLSLTSYVWMPTLVSLGLGYALYRGEHIRVSILTGPTTPKAQRVIEIVGLSVLFIATAVLAYFTTVRAVTATTLRETAPDTQWIEIWPIRWIIVVGLVGLMLQSAAQLTRVLRVSEFDPRASVGEDQEDS